MTELGFMFMFPGIDIEGLKFVFPIFGVIAILLPATIIRGWPVIMPPPGLIIPCMGPPGLTMPPTVLTMVLGPLGIWVMMV